MQKMFPRSPFGVIREVRDKRERFYTWSNCWMRGIKNNHTRAVVTVTTYNSAHAEYAFMNLSGAVILVFLITLIFAAGCAQSSPAPQPVVTTPTLQPVTPTVPGGTPAPIPTTSAPRVTITLIHIIEPLKAWKDADLHFSFAAPENWNVTNMQVPLPEGSQGLIYQTNLDPNGFFTITTFPVSIDNDQAYRDTFRKWVPAPSETTVTINGILFDRFESAANGTTQVGYVARKSSANDLGFASVLRYTTDASHPFDREDFEKLIASFSYFTAAKASSVPGEDIPLVWYNR
jgi:hypothetical protein